MRFNLSLGYVVAKADRKEGAGASEHDHTLTNFLVTQAISARFPAPPGAPNRIIGGQVFPPLGEVKEKGERRMVGRIQNVLTKAMNDDASSVEFTLDQVEWIHRVLDEWGEPPQWSGWAETLRDYVSTLLLEAKQAQKEASVEKKKD